MHNVEDARRIVLCVVGEEHILDIEELVGLGTSEGDHSDGLAVQRLALVGLGGVGGLIQIDANRDILAELLRGEAGAC